MKERQDLVDLDDRGKWGNPAEFILSCLGCSVGLGNIWRFPYLCYTNGGGAFLIPYAIMLTFVGIPIFFIELSIGQYVGGGPMTVWAASPLFLGIGAGMITISFIASVYYNIIIAWSLYYMFASWQKFLPWDGCQQPYNTPYCYSRNEELKFCKHNDTKAIWFNQTCYNSSYLSAFDGEPYPCNTPGINNESCRDNPLRDILINVTNHRVMASEEYFNFGMLNRSDRIEDNGEMQWQIVLCLLLAWILCYVCVVRGIKSSGKVVYFTATFPYLLLIILLIRGALLEGALEGIKFYIIPKWEKLSTPKVWVDAAGQVFFSLSVGMGGLITFASYNKFNNNMYRDTLILCTGNGLTSFFAGFAIFSILGYMSVILDRPVDKVAASGSGLAFVAYPEVVLWLEPPQLWATLFFFMLLMLGLDGQFAGLQNLMTTIVDMKPSLGRHKPWVALSLCSAMFLLGLTQCTRAGVYWTELMSYYSGGWSLVLIAMCEAMVFAWVYGASNLVEDIQTMVGFKLYPHWWVCWTIITPLLMVATLIYNIIDTTPLSYGSYELPTWAQAVGWLMAVASVGMIPIFFVIQIGRSFFWVEYRGLRLWQRLHKLTKPNEDWIPSIERDTRQAAARQAATDTPAETNGDVPPPPDTMGARQAVIGTPAEPNGDVPPMPYIMDGYANEAFTKEDVMYKQPETFTGLREYAFCNGNTSTREKDGVKSTKL